MASRSILSLFVLLFPILSKAQTVDLSGTLKDKFSSAPVAEAVVTLVGQNLKTRTDAQGRFLIQRVPTGMAPTPPGKITFRLRTGNRVAFRLDKPAAVSVRIQDALGSAPATSHRAFLGAGAWDFHPGTLSRGDLSSASGVRRRHRHASYSRAGPYQGARPHGGIRLRRAGNSPPWRKRPPSWIHCVSRKTDTSLSANPCVHGCKPTFHPGSATSPAACRLLRPWESRRTWFSIGHSGPTSWSI